MKKIVFISILSMMLCSHKANAQMDSEPVEVQVIIGDSIYDIEKVSTQTEIKKGWNVVGYTVGGKSTKYLWGRHSHQLIDNPTPFFIISPQKEETLSDFVVIKLLRKKVYRQLAEPVLRDNDYTCIDLVNFVIEARGEDKYLVHPQKRMEPGEYILLNLNQKPHGELNDYYGYCFTIE